MARKKSEDAYLLESKNQVAQEQAKHACCDAITAQKVASTAMNLSPRKEDAVSAPDAGAAPGAYDQAHSQALTDLVNELKAKLDSMNS